MAIKLWIKDAIRSGLGLHPTRNPARGIDVCDDIKLHLRRTPISVIFDVGANEGQSTAHYLKKFPNATIYAFEPVKNSFERLATRMTGKAVNTVNAGLSSLATSGVMDVTGPSTMHHLTPEHTGGEKVQLMTLDGFCAEKGIRRISLLKIDTEGHDLEVLRGSSGMLSSMAIDIVQVEAGMNSTNTRHVPFAELRETLAGFGYDLFAFYEQVGEWPLKQPHLRRTNPVFISRTAIEANVGLSSG
jgi:FkbM family methyltransferase